jgi:hypothetical protein
VRGGQFIGCDASAVYLVRHDDHHDRPRARLVQQSLRTQDCTVLFPR